MIVSTYAYDSCFIILEQRPWSEWKRSDESCRQHTGHDIEQIIMITSLRLIARWGRPQFLLIVSTCSRVLMNLLVVMLWHLKHYHSERYIATEFDLVRKTVAYSLSSVLGILHSCAYPEFISLPTYMSKRTAPYGLEEHHKLIVDSTECKAYYHAKSPTNCALIVHASECYKGTVHDITILRESGLLEYLNDSVQIIAGQGYIGEEYIVTARKKPRGCELEEEDREFDRNMNSARAAVENINQRLKTYSILDGVYRGAIDAS